MIYFDVRNGVGKFRICTCGLMGRSQANGRYDGRGDGVEGEAVRVDEVAVDPRAQVLQDERDRHPPGVHPERVLRPDVARKLLLRLQQHVVLLLKPTQLVGP